MSILFPSFAYAFCRVETLSRKPGTSWCGIRDLLTAQTRHWISFSSQGRQASPDIKAFFCWLCLMMLGGFGWIWDTLGVANNILERRNRRKIEVGSMSQSADTCAVHFHGRQRPGNLCFWPAARRHRRTVPQVLAMDEVLP